MMRRRILLLVLAMVLLFSATPAASAYEAGEPCRVDLRAFIRDREKREYVEMMVDHHIRTDRDIQNALDGGFSAVFLFDGCSDNMNDPELSDLSYYRVSGVCLVVNKLFNLVQPTDAIFGKKDYQQFAILRRMVRDLDMPITLHGAEIVREADGLALSSRNVRLTPEHRAAASLIRKCLLAAAEAYATGACAEAICAQVRAELETVPGVRCDYVELVDAVTLHELTDPERLALLAVAAWFGDVRLIDNIELSRS